MIQWNRMILPRLESVDFLPLAATDPPILKIMENIARKILPAEGYYELNLFDEAWDALDQLADETQQEPVVVELRAMIRMGEERWDEALELAETLCETSPEHHTAFIHAAYCLHELGKTEEARNKLQDGPPALQKDPLYFYNLACYETQLGQTDAARNWLKRACKLDRSLEKQARSDSDLQPLWE